MAHLLRETPFGKNTCFCVLISQDCVFRVFNGQNHSYACVTYQSDADLQRALGSEIRISDTVVVTEAWCPRDRMKRRRSGNTQQKAAEKVAK